MLETITPMKAEARDALLESTRKNEPEKRGRKASKEVRQLQLIEATIDSLAKRGYSETTMADVADGAGLSRGIVNFHFESKEKLLVATLQYMADEYAAHWRAALTKAGDDPARQLQALVAADFDRSICNKRKLAAWCAFWGEAKSRPTYQALCGARDAAYQNVFIDLCATLKQSGGYAFEPQVMALALCALLEGLWLRLMMGTEDTTRETALQSANEFLSAAFPRHYPWASGPKTA
ncbi:transcriptional regulator BetI [Mesorhizobium sp.]|uniref:transcriptional regulator BetI n=1 Tax=Mesorhizobium sp. TaxID=1871066 RepID=UPI00121971F9|nr:transcriptional regulator BetI [Mesorhizobium sp.]TIO09631.1 MAG: transcriptional regulator BetI [Mesorhizobium sp.]TIO34121.1 MAG: transcriptional regulator BetI [Mesorhizobium sp.]TIP11818.1 MAG: transcriptional regulator BetI [Mesorhizobium sp.]